MNVILISFATDDKWYRSQAELNKSAVGKGVTQTVSFNPDNLDLNTTLTHRHLLNKKTRGFGYWMWKPLIIKHTLNKANEGDVVIYVDSGNLIVNDLTYIIEKCIEHNIVLFDNRDGCHTGQCHKNKTWTKRDAFVIMNCDSNYFYEAPQVDASYQLYKKSTQAYNFIEEYLYFCKNEDVISDAPNILKPNLPDFKDHRHDQSVVSLLAAKHQIHLYPEPSEWGNYITRPYPQLFKHHRGVF